ncbi:hypothetical protein Lalb_Chr25g0289461 [Lupinus albus]|uniref:Uncharacterized protein n=1 Tax=Lupinus albus TaxID=3870 RepID=A0A6A4N160_LUPAL|nr:hypothetical protein Lalb_Chr25g0289461 [Lupinus albus]
MISSGNENIVEIKHRLLCTKLELVTARKEANMEIKKYEDTIKGLFKLLKRVSQERDEARDKLHFLLRSFHQPNSAEASTTIPQVGHYPKHPKVKNTKVIDLSSKPFSNGSFDLALATPQSNENHFGYQVMEYSQASLALPNQPNYQRKYGIMKVLDIGASSDNMGDNTSLVIDKLDWEKPLPQKGRQLLQTLPQWQNPHSLSSSSCFPPSVTQDNDFSTKTYDKESGNPSSVILTSLSLAFPGNCYGPSHMSSAKNEPVSYEDMDSCRMHNHNHVLTGKKRKLF